MGRRLGVGLIVMLVTAAVVVVVVVPAGAEPPPGSVTATVADVCGFVRADFVNADPVVPGAAFIRFSRNGKLLESFGEQVNSGMSATLYQVAAAGDVIHYEWDVDGGTTESLEHTHVTPPGCDEPRLSVSLVDTCGPEFTIAVGNTGTAPAEVVISAPTLKHVPYIVAAGGVVTATVPGVDISAAWVGRHRPGPAAPGVEELVVVDAVQRAPGCGIPWPNDNLITVTPACNTVTIVLYALDMKGLVTVYRNGNAVHDFTVDTDIYKFAVAVRRNDIVTIDQPPQATYVHRPPTGCAGAAAPAPTPARAVKASPPPAPPPTAPAALSPSPEASAAESPPTPHTGQPPDVAEPPDPPGTPVAAITAGVVISVVVIGFAGWFLIGARRRRQPVWAVAFATRSPRPAVDDTGLLPSMSLRWIARPGPRTHTLREDPSL